MEAESIADEPAWSRFDSHQYSKTILAILTNQPNPLDSDVKDYAQTFLDLLDHKLGRLSCAPVLQNSASLIMPIEPSAARYGKEDLKVALYPLLAITASELASGGTSVEAVARKIVKTQRLSHNGAIPATVHQLAFKLISLLTMLYTAADKPETGKFELIVSNPDTKARFRHQQNLTWHQLKYNVTDTSVEKDLDHLLASFGNPIIQRCYPPAARRDFYEDMLIASNLNYDTLHKIGRLNIEWVDAISLHLELHERSSKLKLFAYPSFCAMLCANSTSQETFLSK